MHGTLILAVGVAAGLAVRVAPAAAPRAVSCTAIVGGVSSGRFGNRPPMFGVVSTPSRYLPRVVATKSRPWRFSSKVALVVRANAGPVTVRVPTAWRRRAAIEWGDSGIVPALRIPRCPPTLRWNVFGGAIHLRERTACVPLVFGVGRRRARVSFGVGRLCGAH